MKKAILLSTLLLLPAGSCVYMIKDAIKKKYFKDNAIDNKDMTRYNSNYYGLSWGSKTDEIV